MKIETITSCDHLLETEPLKVSHLLWGTAGIPETSAYMAYVEGEGLYITMICKEPDPLRTYVNHLDPVYLDSAMEAFIQIPSDSNIYMNYEINANGAVLAEYGSERKNRTRFTISEIDSLNCKTFRDELQWGFSICVPLSIIHKIYGSADLKEIGFIYCNFYKICEGAQPQQFASFAPVLTKTPDFHRPEYFKKARLNP